MSDDVSPPLAPEPPAPEPAVLDVSGLTLRGDRGVVFSDVGFQAGRRSLVAVHAGAGTGRTSLLLALAGRVRFSAGRATVAGLRLPRQRSAVQQVVALGLVHGVNDLDDTLRVADIVGEQVALRRNRADQPRVTDVLAAADLALDPRRVVHDLRPDEAVRLGVALALLSEPKVLVADDVDEGLTHSEQDVVWGLLRRLADEGTTVVAACVDPDPMVRYVDLVVSPRPGCPGSGAPDPAPEDAHARS